MCKRRMLRIETSIHFWGLLLVTIILYTYNNNYEGIKQTVHQIKEEQDRRTHYAIVEDYMQPRENWTTSVLGSWLFKSTTYVVPKLRTYIVYMKKYESLGKGYLEGCSVKNCIFTEDDRSLPIADAVFVNLHNGIIPNMENRDPQQRWIFLNDESPKHAYTLARKNLKLSKLANIFNWSMTYRSDSDIPVPYGRTVPLEQPVFKSCDSNELAEIIPYWRKKRRDVLATIFLSQCATKLRTKFVKDLQHYIPVDVYGNCSDSKTLKNLCPGRSGKTCAQISEYLFYLALENSKCREYLTEQVWYNSYMKGAIPIIMGPSLSDCKRLLPPNSFIHISSHNTSEIEKLAQNILYLSEDEDLLLSFHQWRNHFAVINEQGYLGRKSTLFCRLCEGLNYNDERQKVYSEQDIREFIGPKLSCGKYSDSV